ncbi:STAS domain-containing protein [Robertmurraya andreesenii]|uniref:Anti-sigma B factor antagonist n=1 Tax=Anoxybacillus andreesenii TaxID=1325932 RepID=A0ABT9V393_9BACL|nr:STAS domain-containing protein [Robertmurraya andreesenii]MDQ0155421.1 anti-sigma B factor antagonist [Robertmurraya andreesenii]
MESSKPNIRIETRQEFVTIFLEGNLEYGMLEEIKKVLQNQNLETDQGYVIDVQRVNNIDSTGFGMIVNFAKRVSVKGKKIVFIVVDDFIRNLFAISQVDKVFPIVDNMTAAQKEMVANWTGELSINEY